MRPHVMRARHDALDERFDTAAGRLLAMQSRLDDAGVVEDEQVARLQQHRQVAEDAIDRQRAGAVEQA